MMWKITKMAIGVGMLAFALDFGYQFAVAVTGSALKHMVDDEGLELNPEQIRASFNAVSTDEVVNYFKMDYEPFHLFRP